MDRYQKFKQQNSSHIEQHTKLIQWLSKPQTLEHTEKCETDTAIKNTTQTIDSEVLHLLRSRILATSREVEGITGSEELEDVSISFKD